MVSLDSIRDNWPWVGSILTVLSTCSLAVRRFGGPRKLALAIRSQWQLNLVVLDLENRLARAERAEARALKGEQEANDRADEAVTAMQTMLSAVSAVQEARAKGFLQISPPSSNAPTPPPATSTTLPTKRPGPLDILDR